MIWRWIRDSETIGLLVHINRVLRTGPQEMDMRGLEHLRSMGSILELVRFLNANPEWLITLNLRKRVRGRMTYKVPNRSTFYKFADRPGRRR
jgi:hypothetical protein